MNTWEEGWYARHTSACRWEICRRVKDDTEIYGRLIATLDDPDDDIPGQRARSDLIAAAPEMARLLLGLEWPDGHWSHNADGGAGCAICGNSRNHGHAPDCHLIAVLRKAGVKE